jgi:large subunit ribosomal protein L25
VSSHDLTVTSRETTGKEAAKKLRRAGSVPAVAYGHKEEPVKLAVNAKELRDLLAHGGSHSLLTLKQEGGADVPVIIKSMQRHPVSHAVTSVDFLRVSLNEKVTMTVPIHLEGEPDSVRVEGGVLVQALHELQVEAFPQNIPDHITVDVTGLVFNGAPIHVREVTLPQGVTAVTDGEEAVAVVNPPTVEPEPETVEAADASEVPAEHGSSDDETSDGGDTNTDNS